jgi:hypothetical protein
MENRFPPVTEVHDMMDRAGRLNSQLARHTRTPSPRRPNYRSRIGQ